MKTTLIICLLFISSNVFCQNLAEIGLEDNPNLTQAESEFLNDYIPVAQSGNFDFKNKKVLFVTGNTGNKISNKSEYFNNIRQWEKIRSAGVNGVVSYVILLNKEEKLISGGYDAIVTYWVKMFSEKRKKKIINYLKNQ